MPRVTFMPVGQSFEVAAGTTILVSAIQNGLQPGHECTEAICGTDRVKILSGKEHLSEKNENEELTLEMMNAGPDERLACGRPVCGDASVDVLYDSDTAALKLILVGEMHPKELPDANSVVAMPTACASMVGTDLLARKDCRVAGVFGAGDQARLHLLALTCIRKSIDKVRVFSPTRETREKFAAEMSAVLSIAVIAADSAAEVVDGADVIVCATNSNVPVFDGNWLVPGQHVTSIVSINIGLKKPS